MVTSVDERYGSYGVRQQPMSKDLESLDKGVDWMTVAHTDKERELIQKVLKARRRSRRNAAIFAGMASAGFALAVLGILVVLHSSATENRKERVAGISLAVPGHSLFLTSLVPLAIQTSQNVKSDLAQEELNKATQQRLEKRRFADAIEHLSRRRVRAENGHLVSVPLEVPEPAVKVTGGGPRP